MEKKNSFMQTKPVFSLLLSMSVPMMLSMLIQSLYNIVTVSTFPDLAQML